MANVDHYTEDLAVDPPSTPEEHIENERERVRDLHRWIKALEDRYENARERGGVKLHVDLDDVRVLLALSRVSVGLYRERLEKLRPYQPKQKDRRDPLAAHDT